MTYEFFPGANSPTGFFSRFDPILADPALRRKLYIKGGPDAPSLPLLICGVVFLGGGALFLALLTYTEWKRNKTKYDAYMAELRQEAEAKRAAEEEEAAEQDAEDAYYEALESGETE